MSIVRNNVAQLYTPIYDKFMLESYNAEPMVCKEVYDVIVDPTKEWKYDELTQLGIWVDATEGASGGYSDPVLGYPKTLTPAKRWQKFKVSFEAVDQDEYALIKQIGKAQSIGRGLVAHMEKSTANYLIDGFGSSATSPDGEFLWDTDHPKNRDETGTVYDNLLSDAFSHDALEDAETQITNNFIDSTGIPILPSEDPILLYPPALRGAVKRVLADRALEQPDTTMRNINRFAGMYRPIEWRWLAAKFGGSDTAWFIIYPSLGFLKIVKNAEAHFTSWIDEDTENYHFKGRVLYDWGATNWRAGFASTGV